MAELKKSYTEIHSLNPRELIDWCNARCKELGVSRSKLADITGVPESTLDRILTGKNPEFRYSSIQPIIAYLVGYRHATPEPDREDESQGEFYFNTIKGYKLIVDNKNHLISEYENAISQLEKQVEFLKSENEKKDSIIETFQSHLKWMESKIDK